MSARSRPGFLSVIAALVLRELSTRFGRRQLGYVWGLLEPGTYVVVAMVLFYVTGRSVVTEMKMPLFILTGICPWLLFMRTDNFIRASLHTNVGLLYHPILTPLHFYIARFVLEAATGILFVFIAFIGYRIGWNDPQAVPVHPDRVIAGAMLALGLGFGVGACIAPLMVRFPGFAYTLGFVIRALFLTSGVYYIPDYAPHAWRPVIFWNPMTHAIALFRSGFSSDYPAHMLMPSYTILVILTVVFVGLTMERFFARRWVMS